MTAIRSINVYPTVDTSLPSFDNTKLVAINTCPTWGIIRYSAHKVMNAGSRAMALEAGQAAHEVFAAHRLFSLFRYGTSAGVELGTRKAIERNTEIINIAGIRIFGEERLAEMWHSIDTREDVETQQRQFCLTALYNSGFYDDPADKRRTVSNIEEMCIAYMEKFDWSKQLPLVIDDGVSEPFIGIEIPVDVTIEYTMEDGEVHQYRFIGKADGIHHKDHTSGLLRVHENKTASRLGEAWEQSWETNHQPTGYMIALSAMLGTQIRDALMLGTALPMPKSYALNGLSRVPITRHDHHIQEWFEWFLHTVQLHDQYLDNPIEAPKYTHSCNRYFRPCSFIPLCASPLDERREMYEEMQQEKWSPLEDEGSAD